MARNSRSRTNAAFAAFVILVGGASTSAHRLDEYLQAARISIDPDRVRIELDLTPGMSVAGAVLSDIDRDRDGSISDAEGKAYVARVVGALSIDVDGVTVTPTVTSAAFPSPIAIRNGVGIIQIRLTAPLAERTRGAHRLRFRNAYRPDIGVYLANALVPANDRVAITGQERDVDQRNVYVDYVVTTSTDALNGRAVLLLSALGVALIWTATVSRRRSSDRPPDRSA
jgi:hypothetical protein